jgi:hypothetical protein
MSNATKLAAALSLAGAMLTSSPASFAQEQLTPAYVGVYADCYYNISLACGPNGSYAAIVTTPVDAYAAVNGIVPQPYFAVPRWYSPRLRAPDWVAIHGANF